jgi:hypothetical protein
MSGLAQWLVREAEHQRKYGAGWASRSNLKFIAMVIIANKHIDDGVTPF